MDTNTINRFLALSEEDSKLSWRLQGCDEDRDNGFRHWPQVLCGTVLGGRCYWEVEWGGAVYISVAHEGMSRGRHHAASWFGRNKRSWSLRCAEGEAYHVYHDETRTTIASPDKNSTRVGVYLDCSAETLSFYCVSGDKELHLHTFRCSLEEDGSVSTFSQPLCAGFGLCWSRDDRPSYVKLC